MILVQLIQEMMIYPKIQRRTLALILFCLVITLGAMGILFLVYFFNEGSALSMDSSFKPVYSDSKQNQLYKQTIIDTGRYNSERKYSNRYTKDNEGNVNQARISNTKSSNSHTSNFDLPVLSASAFSQELGNNHGNEAVFVTKTINSKASKDYNTNVDTIYIDDFDRPTYISKSKTGLNNIDYFDTILIDEKKSTHSAIYDDNVVVETSNTHSKNSNERKSTINSNRGNNGIRFNKTKLLRNTKVTHDIRADDNMYDLDIDTISGSGDFIDDTEINEIFIKQIKSKMIRKESNAIKSVKKSSIKSNRTRKKHRNYFLHNDNNFVSTPPQTSSAGIDGSTYNWASQQNLKKQKSYPTMPSYTTVNVHSSSLESFSELTNRMWPVPAHIPSYKKSIVYEYSNYSANLQNSSNNNNFQSQLEIGELSSTATAKVFESSISNIGGSENNEAWVETRTRRIMGNVKKSEERSRQLLLCEEAGGGELCRMLFKGHIND